MTTASAPHLPLGKCPSQALFQPASCFSSRQWELACAPAGTELHQTDKINLRGDRRGLSPGIGSWTCGDCLGLSHVQRNSHTPASTSIISLCMCVPVYMRSCIRASIHVCARACTPPHTHTRSTQEKVKGQLPALCLTEHTGKGPRTTFSSLPPF